MIMSHLIWDIIHELDALKKEADLCEVRGLHSHHKTIHTPCPKATLKALRFRLKELIKDSDEE